MNKLLFALSLSRKSGKLLCGFDRVKESALTGRAKLIISARDTSRKSEKNIRYYAERGNIPFHITRLSRFDLSRVTGRRRGVLAVTDENLARLCLGALSTTEGEH